MGIAEFTVKVLRTHLMRKMQARSLPELSRRSIANCAISSGRMSKENPRWGASRIHGELLMLGFERTFENRRSVPIAAQHRAAISLS
jgi:hypothetical protein